MMYWYGGSGMGYALMGVGMLVFWGLVVAAVVLLVRLLGGDRQIPPDVRPGDPMAVLRERFARGEIDESEYRQRLKVLGGG
jgi:putative membrane protein